MKLKIAFLEVSHWHFPLYIQGLQSSEHSIVAVSDEDNEFVTNISNELRCNAYTNYKDLVYKERPDFIFAFGKHNEMAEIAEFLINEKIPFSIEKPVGINSIQTKRLLSLQEGDSHFVAIPFVFRYSPFIESISVINRREHMGSLTHCFFRFLAGSPKRYSDSKNSWMLDSKIAGGGCTLNLSVHFIDLFLLLTRNKITNIYSALHSLTHKTEIEDFSSIILCTDKNQIGVIETGYTYPENSQKCREIYYSITTDNGFIWAKDDSLHWIKRKGNEKAIALNLKNEDYYSMFLETVLEEFINGMQPRASLKEMHEVMEVVDASYLANRDKRVINLISE